MAGDQETKLDTAAEPKLDAPDVAKPDGAADTGGGEPATQPGVQPSQGQIDWARKVADLEAQQAKLAEQNQNLLRGMNQAQQETAIYRKQMEALAGVQNQQREDPLVALNREAEELESAYRFSEAAPIRSRIAAEVSRRAAREEFQRLTQQQSVQNTQARVSEILRAQYGIDPSLATDLSAKATSNPEAIAAALALAHDPEVVEKATQKRIEERKRKAEAAQRATDPFGGTSGGRRIPGSTQQGGGKRQVDWVSYAGKSKSVRAEIDKLVAEGAIELINVPGA